LCGYEGGIVPSTSAMFGMPNIDGGLRAVDRGQRSGAAKQRGELDAGIPRATSLCSYEGGIVPSASVMFGMPNIDGGPRTADRLQGSRAAKRRGELDAGIRGQSPCAATRAGSFGLLRNVRHAEHRWRAPNCRSTATLRERRNGEGSSTLEFRGQSPCAAMRAG